MAKGGDVRSGKVRGREYRGWKVLRNHTSGGGRFAADQENVQVRDFVETSEVGSIDCKKNGHLLIAVEGRTGV